MTSAREARLPLRRRALLTGIAGAIAAGSRDQRPDDEPVKRSRCSTTSPAQQHTPAATRRPLPNPSDSLYVGPGTPVCPSDSLRTPHPQRLPPQVQAARSTTWLWRRRRCRQTSVAAG